MPSTLSDNIAEDTKIQILNALVTGGCTLHSGEDVLDFTRVLFAGAAEEAIKDRKEEETSMGMNGGYGEAPAGRALARAYVLLVDNGEERNAAELKDLALARFTADTFDNDVRAVQAGW